VAGPSGAFLLLALATLAAGAWSAWRLACWARVPAADARALMVLMAGWQPVLAALRDGQWSIVVAALCLGAWWRARSGRAVSGGALLGCAAALKLHPALLIVPFVRASRRGAVAAAAAFVAAAVGATAIVGRTAWAQYPAAARAVTAGHVNTHTNLGLLARFGGAMSWPFALACWTVAGIALVVVTLARTTRQRGENGTASFDRGFASFCCLSVVLSPVAWPHYAFLLSLPIVMAWTLEWNESHRAGLSLVLAATLMLSLPVTETSRIGFTLPSGLSSGLAVLRTGALLAIWWSLVRSRPGMARPVAAR